MVHSPDRSSGHGKVAIVGCSGSGKSYLARKLDRLLDAPVTHLDAIYYDDEWNPLPMERFEAMQRELVAAARWVIDGNCNSTLRVRLEAADTDVGRTIRAAATIESPATFSAMC